METAGIATVKQPNINFVFWDVFANSDIYRNVE